MTGTGTLQVTYKVDVTIVMPGVPGGLTACQERRVKRFSATYWGRTSRTTPAGCAATTAPPDGRSRSRPAAASSSTRTC